MKKITLEKVLKLYKDHEIVGINEFFVPGLGWGKEVSNNSDETIEQQINNAIELGATTVQFKLKSTLTDQFHYPDYKISELISK